MSDTALPLPATDGLFGEFYANCHSGQLCFQRCSDCKAWRHVPREMCAACGSFNWAWQASSGRGRLFTWTVAAVAMHPAFKGQTPYAVCVIEMDEGVRMVSRIEDCAIEDLAMDMKVEVVYKPVAELISLPMFRRAQQ